MGGVFSTLQQGTINVSNLASFYNPALKRWEVSVPCPIQRWGSSGNVAQGQVRSSGISGVSVTNNLTFFGGYDREEDRDLILRAMNSVASSDVGTERGFLQLTADIVGVQNIKVVASGHELMQRTKDSSGVHRGGKS